MTDGQCMHFNGMQHELCKRGVRYDRFKPGKPCIQLLHKSARGGTYLRAGEVPAETKPFPGAQAKECCPFYAELSAKEVQDERAASDAHLEKTIAAIKVAGAWRVRPKPAQDRSGTVECPVCKGKLHLSQSAYNGHVHGKCETADCVAWME